MPDDPFKATEFRFRPDNAHNMTMLEYQAERLFRLGDSEKAALFAIAGGLYAIAVQVGIGKESD